MNLFPYDYRPYQKELINFIKENIDELMIFIEAPTGFGKTPVILAALLEKALKNKKHIIWAVRTGNETDRPIEELKEIVKKINVPIFGISYRGKKDMCLLAREMNITSYSEVSYICQKKRKECKYYRNFLHFRFPELPKEPLLYSEILEYAKSFNICPYYLEREMLNFANVVSLSYNYIVSDLGWSIRRIIPFYESYLVVDEAHNLQFAAGSLFSDKITLTTIKRAINELKELRKGESDIYKAFNHFLKFVIKFGEGFEEEKEFDPIKFLDLAKFDTKFIDEAINLGMKVRGKRLEMGKAPRSSLYHFGKFWQDSLELYGTDGIAFIASKEKENIILERWDMRSAEILKDKWPDFYGIVFCSGTLRPMNAFAETTGIAQHEYKSKIVPYIFDINRIRTLLMTDLTTKGEDIPEDMRELYLQAIDIFVANYQKNIAIFNASYRIQEILLDGLKEIARKHKRNIFIEYEGMPGDEGRKILDEFKKSPRTEIYGILVASMSGRFAEGADFPGEELEGIFLVGIPFDRVTARTKLYVKYYTKLYGMRRGYYLSYTVPALRRASQALGRALRAEDDKALFILGDKRYRNKRYFSLLPYYVRKTTKMCNLEMLKDEIINYLRYQNQYDTIKSRLKNATLRRKKISISYERNGHLEEYEILPQRIESGYLFAIDQKEGVEKRFLLSKIQSISI
ncbi:MAG: ATP-dependent DNA helicase [Candidatus Odinarchaeota archaeon]|nr:ATP-dependent DNA helicase [Candidatus Odinarchaeota archaeon]